MKLKTIMLDNIAIKFRLLPFIGTLASIIALTWFLATYDFPGNINLQAPKSSFLMIGSGTVCKYLKSNHMKLLEKYNVNLFSGPSGPAVSLLIDKDHDGMSIMNLIALSSTLITDKFATEERWKCFQNGDSFRKLVSVKIADDYLKVGVIMPEAPCFNLIKGDTVYDTLLYRYISGKSSEYKVYRTSPESGTWTEYEKMFKNINRDFSWESVNAEYYDANNWSDAFNRNEPELYLCSNIYCLKNIDSKIVVRSSDKSKFVRGLYLIFEVSKQDFNDQQGGYVIEGKLGELLLSLKNEYAKNDNTNQYKIANQKSYVINAE